MTAPEDEFFSILSPANISTMSSPYPALILERLNKNIIHTIDSSPNLVENAFRLLAETIRPLSGGMWFDEIFYLPPHAPPSHISTANPGTLRSIFESIVFINTPLTTYSQDCDFYYNSDGRLHKYHSDFQRAVKNALLELQGIRFYLDRIDNFWSARHEAYSCTNKEYMARSLAAQIQCANMVKKEDGSFNLESVDLLLRLAHLNITPEAYAYRVSLTQSANAADISLIGAFLITRKPEDTVDSMNSCVLYIPGVELQQFDSITMMKTYLAVHLINPMAPRNPFLRCIALFQQRGLEDLINRRLLDVQNITLSPFPIDSHFFSDHIEALIDQHKQDLTYSWSQTNRPLVTTTNPGDFQPRYKWNHESFLFFRDTLQHHAIPALEAWQQGQLPVAVTEPVPELEPTPTLLKPIKLHVIFHKDLEPNALTVFSSFFMFNWLFTSRNFLLMKDNYFSWLITELENISSRKVELIEIKKEAAPELYNFKYTSKTIHDASARWKKAVTQYLERTSQTTSQLDKFILLTYSDPVPFEFSGLANTTGGQFAIASIQPYSTFAHEVGHLLGAEHDAAAVIYDGWWSDTLMSSSEWRAIRTTAYRFSDKNRELIKTYLSQFD